VDDYVDFLAGKLQITLILDIVSLQGASEQAGFYLEFIGEEEMYLKFTRINDPEFMFAVTYHYFGRIFLEFISPSWFLEEEFKVAERLRHRISQMKQ
jgi:hypothetical protein